MAKPEIQSGSKNLTAIQKHPMGAGTTFPCLRFMARPTRKKLLSPRYGLLSYMRMHSLTKRRAISKTLKERLSWHKCDDFRIQLSN
jgi:hypothetical protein